MATQQGTAHLGPGEGSSWWFATELHTFKAVGATTNGAYSLTEVTASSEFMAPPHIHHHEDEAFYVLEGEMDFVYEGSSFTAGPGSFVYLQKGRLHQHGARGSKARVLVLHTPAGIEGFISAGGTPATDKNAKPAPAQMSDVLNLVAIAKKYGIEVPPPPDSGSR